MPAIHVRCPGCTSRQTYIVMTRQLDDGTIIRRRRCDGCNHRWYTQQPAEAEVSPYALQWIDRNTLALKQECT